VLSSLLGWLPFLRPSFLTRRPGGFHIGLWVWLY
jgi:hypothetical protein